MACCGKKQITRHEIEQRHSYAGYFGADYVLAEREHGKPGRFGQQVSVDHNMVQSCVYQYHSHNERKAQEADGSGLYVFFFFQCFFQCFIF